MILDYKHRGFTLIELLVVISIISLLSSVVLASLSGVREQAKIVAARSELDNIRRAIERMKTDTGALPGGCTPAPDASNILLYLYEPQAGLTQQPSTGDVSGYYPSNRPPCTWTSHEVSSWDGPYISNSEALIDPWGNPYVIDTYKFIAPKPPDPDSCKKGTLNSKYTGRGPKIYSQGVWTRSNGQGVFNNYNPTSNYSVCDDIWVDIGRQE